MQPDEPKNPRSSSLFDLKVNPPKKDSYLEYAKCNQGKSCVTLCISDHCEADAALCSDQECKCKENHDNGKICSRIRLSKIVSMTETKGQIFPDVFQWAIIKYNELVDWISDQWKRLCQHLNSVSLSQDEISFLKAVYDGKCNKLKGNQMYKVVNQANLQSKKFQQMTAQVHQQLSKQWQSQVKKIQKEVVSINSLITKTCMEGGLKSSKVLLTETERATMTEMLEDGNSNRKVAKFELLYRASDNNFEVGKFWEKCNHKADTVTVARTEFNKVIGGYTPLSWKEDKNDYQQDPSLRSFLFSVTNKAKFTLKQSHKHMAICPHRCYGPCFGRGQDFHINWNASNIDSYACIGYSYENSKVQYNTKESWQFFQGSRNNYCFKTKEWEVWQVTFQ